MSAAPPPPPQQPVVLSLRAVTLGFGARTLVRHLDLDVRAGERIVVVGPNGSGKSTLFDALAGLAAPAAGRIERPGGLPGMQFQDGALWPHMSVEKHLRFADVQDDGAWRERLLTVFDLLHLSDARPERLSGGERLRLSLARALAGRPRWVLLDEPLAQLDPHTAGRVRENLPPLLDELGAASLAVTHDPDDVLLLGDRLLALSGRGPWWTGPARFALDAPPTPELATFAGRGTLLSGTADDDGRARLDFGLVLEGCAPASTVHAHLDATGVRIADAVGVHTLPGEFVAPDRRGGSWLRIDGRLVRSTDPPGALRAGQTVAVRLCGVPRLLESLES